MAKERGLPSRAAFKLEEIQARWRVIRGGGRVLDLGRLRGNDGRSLQACGGGGACGGCGR